MLDGFEWVALLALVVIVAGGKKLPELGSGLGKGISEFKKAMGAADVKESETKPASEAKPADSKSEESK